jgi:hypothetical protein
VCLRTLPAVFDTARRRWIDPARAPAEAVMAAVAKCPSGALQSALVTAVHPSISSPTGATTPDGSPVAVESTKPGAATMIRVCDKGELLVEGPFRLVDADGNVLREGNRCSLCRCGHSKTKPFCDNTHETLDGDW